ncbi:MAG: XRE family transcriptional regulator [Trueperaceae bacterium]|nr:XRE family transcriptional regulator [Trueperaceae bacterium]
MSEEHDGARTWEATRKEAVAGGRMDQQRIVANKERARARVRAHRLASIRADRGLNQTTLAARLEVSQPRVSRIERGDLESTQLATLRAYIEALGGELEVTAKFGDDRIIIVD